MPLSTWPAITSIDPSLYEAATLDGAGRWGKIWHVTLPGIKSTIMILLIMNIGNVLNAGFEVQYLLGNGLVKSVSETIDIYTLTWGISQNDLFFGYCSRYLQERRCNYSDSRRKLDCQTCR